MNKYISIFIIAIGFSLNGYSQTVSDGEYFIQVNTTKKYIAIEGISQDNGAKLVQWDFANNPNHKFIIKNTGNNLYTIKAVHSGKYLSLEGTQGQQGAKIIQWDWVNQDNQKWFISASSKQTGSFSISTAAGMKRIRLTGNHGNPANGAYFILNDEEPANYFTLRKNEVEPSGSILKTQSKTTSLHTNVSTKILADVQDGIYKIRINQSGKYLAIAGEDDRSNGMRLIQWDMLPRNNHLFRVTKLSNGNYSIAAVHSKKLLDVVDRKTDDGTQIQQWENLNGDNQQWKFYNETGGLSIVSVASGKKLQLSGGITNTSDGTSLIITSGSTQTFTLLPAREIPFTETITLSNLRLAVPHGGDLDIYGSVIVYLYDDKNNLLEKLYATSPYLLGEIYEKDAIDMDKNRVVDFTGKVILKIPSNQIDGARLVINYGLNEDDADAGTAFGTAYNFIPPDDKHAKGGANDFFKLRNSFNDCTKGRIDNEGFRFVMFLEDLPAQCQVHTNLQDEDGSDNYIDVYYTITRERK